MKKTESKHTGRKPFPIWKRGISLSIALAMTLTTLPVFLASAADSQAETKLLIEEDYNTEITAEEAADHATPTIKEWDFAKVTAEASYQDGWVYLNKLEDGATAADLLLPLSKGYASQAFKTDTPPQPVAEGTPATALYIELEWQAHKMQGDDTEPTRLYIKGITEKSEKQENMFYITQSGNKLIYKRADNNDSVTGTLTVDQTEQHTIRLLLQPNENDSYTLVKSWVDGEVDMDTPLEGIAPTSDGKTDKFKSLYSVATSEYRGKTSGAGNGSGFGSLKVWQPAEDQLQAIIDAGADDIAFSEIQGENSDANAVTEDLNLETGSLTASGLLVTGWESSNPDVIAADGTVTRPTGADARVEVYPVLAIRDVIGDGGADFQPVDVTAKGNPIVVTVLQEEMTNALEEAKNALNFDLIKGENPGADQVTTDLKLIRELYGVGITWELVSIEPSGTSAAVDTATGEIRRPAQDEQDAVVTLRAALSLDGETDTKKISFTIKKRESALAETQVLTYEDYEQEMTDPAVHAVPSISEWKDGQTTAQATYQDGRVYFNKTNSGGYSADLIIPLTAGYADGQQPVSAGTPATDIYIEFDWKAHNASTRLYLRGSNSGTRGENLFYITQDGNYLKYAKADNTGTTGSVAAKQTDSHTIRLLLQRSGDTYVLAKSWIDGVPDKDLSLNANTACNGLYSLVVDERRNSGTGLGSSFGSLKVWQPAEAQLQTMIDDGKANISFLDICGNNTAQDAVTENLDLSAGQILESGLTIAGWESSNPEVVGTDGTVTRPAEADATVRITPLISIWDVVGDGSADFEPQAVTLPGNPITVTVQSLQLEDVKQNLSFEQIKGDNTDAANVETDLNLISEMNGVAIAWSVKSLTPAGTNAEIDIATGSVRRPLQTEQDVQAVLTATLSRGGQSDTKDITFTVKKLDTGAAEYLQQISQRLTFAVIAGENTSQARVQTDLNLTDKFNGAELVWSSSNPDVITPDGTVTYPVYPEPDAAVVLTVSMTLNGAGPLTKEFRVTVPQGDAENLAQDAEIKTNISGVSAEQLEYIRDNEEQTYIEIGASKKEFTVTFDMKARKNISRVDFITYAEEAGTTACKGYVIEVSDNGTSWTQVFAGNAVSGKNIADFKPVSARYVRLSVTEKETGTMERLAEAAVRFCPSGQNLVEADAESMELDLPSRITASTVTLPTKGSFGSELTWSFNPDGIFEETAADGVYRVNHASSDQTVSLIATFASGSASTQVRRTHTVSGIKGGSGGSAGGGGGGSHSSSGSGSNASNISIPNQVTPLPPAEDNAAFADLDQAEWAADYIEALYKDGIVNGKGNGSFAPLDSVTREEFVKMLVLALDMEPADHASVNFADVALDSWYAPYVACAVQNGMVQGISSTEFGVGQPITREDMSVMAARAIAAAGQQTETAEGQTAGFADWEQIADYAKESVALLAGMGLIQGDENGAFCPQDNTSRAEAAKILYLLRETVK